MEVVSNKEVGMSNPKPQEATGQEEKEIKGSKHIWVWELLKNIFRREKHI